ncbi:MAG: type II toxin-antitoxin system prevent-host-death family antitoxin [Chloroflexi bacterium]|nr:type II toxin-antitoxin system prevent-host-death family antitoxin [Chloroflexota bacterium]MCY3937164.1 type II toxin-antitoxin system prevent-host-death family antitoxin [Chloroflexota bacterium]
MREIQATEAKSRLAELLRAVEHGETVAITRHGKVVAHLVPADVQDRANRERAVERFRERRAGWRRVPFSTDEILAARHEGHRI